MIQLVADMQPCIYKRLTLALELELKLAALIDYPHYAHKLWNLYHKLNYLYNITSYHLFMTRIKRDNMHFICLSVHISI